MNHIHVTIPGISAKLRLLALFCATVFLFSASPCPASPAPDMIIQEGEQPREVTPDGTAAEAFSERLVPLEGYSAWIAEWTMQPGLREAYAQKNGLESVQIFSAYFDESGAPYLPQQVLRWLAADADEFRKNLVQLPIGARVPIYLTVVNDVTRPEGTIFKDPNIVSRLVGTSEARAAHIDDLLALLDIWHFDGLDIDYEQVKAEDWENFLTFCQELYAELEKEGKLMRVVLEPKKIYYERPLPEGPEYVLMAYNLFGGHSGPGPKANPEFIARLAGWTSQQASQPRFALATGGFQWDMARGNSDSERVLSVTESEAQLIAQREGLVPQRDKESQYLFFSFPEGVKKPKVVWFADGETLAFLADAARKVGYKDFALWRLGGNRRFSLDTWRANVTLNETGGEKSAD